MKVLVKDLRVTQPSAGNTLPAASPGAAGSGGSAGTTETSGATGSTASTFQGTFSSSLLNFGSVEIGDQLDKSVVFVNQGNQPLQLGAVGITGSSAYTASTDCPSTLQPGLLCNVTVRFKPITEGTLDASAKLETNATSSPHLIQLTGIGTIARGELVAEQGVSFGTVQTGSTVTRDFVFYNNGTAAARNVAASLTGANFSIASNTCGTAQNPGIILAQNNCRIRVAYSPSAGGASAATLSVTSTAVNSPSSLSLSANAEVPTPIGDGVSKAGACASGAITGCAVWGSERAPGAVPSSSNPQLVTASGNQVGIYSNVCKSSGKWYSELRRTTQSNPANYFAIGVGRSGVVATYWLPSEFYVYPFDGKIYNTINDTLLGVYGTGGQPTVGEWVGVALNLDVSPKTATVISATKSVTFNLPSQTGSYCMSVGFMHGASGEINAGQQNFQYAVPAGFVRGLY